ncbi:acyltransferase family protein [Lederbergia panacisoli]|uniref:acyltransferase family protein n=1 Tax=Lederbergia panacisoli TaxID=1255251 RepID=UPI00214A9966|nr:acyltransferase family protein [Lederbergia panacisoli]MCR2823639.1 acyltransferase family protein [Lederbergia panacisoli]
MKDKAIIERRYDIDWLRNLGILLLFPFHSARVFDFWDPFYVKSESLSEGLSWFIAATSFWFMPLLFWLAGSASWYALQKRTKSQYVKERYERLFIPLIVGVLIIVPPQGYYALLHHTGEAGNYFLFLKEFFLDFSDLSGYFGTFTPAHLWFILYLFVLSIVALPIFSKYMNLSTVNINKFNRVLSKPFVFISLFTLVLLLAQALPAPGGQNPFYFMVIIIAGFLTASDLRYQEMFNRIRFKTLLLVIILVPAHIILINVNQDAPNFSAMDIFITSLRTMNTLLTLIVILGYGNKVLNFPHKAVSYMNEAAFPIYIVHQSILVVIGYYIIQLNYGVFLKFLIIMFLTLAVSFAFYEFIIKRIAIARVLFGLKVQKKIHGQNQNPNIFR